MEGGGVAGRPKMRKSGIQTFNASGMMPPSIQKTKVNRGVKYVVVRQPRYVAGSAHAGNPDSIQVPFYANPNLMPLGNRLPDAEPYSNSIPEWKSARLNVIAVPFRNRNWES